MKDSFGKFADIAPDDLKVDLDDSPRETPRERLWRECVTEAKGLLKMTVEARFKIVDLALKCCVIHHGGRAVSERYTVTHFAKEVGIAPKTLSEWMRIKTNIADNLSTEDRASLTMNEMKFIDSKLVGVKRDDKFAAKVVRVHKKLKGIDPATIKMQKYVKHLKSVHFNVKNPMMIKNCDPEILVEVLHLCREIAFALKHIDTQTKAKK